MSRRFFITKLRENNSSNNKIHFTTSKIKKEKWYGYRIKWWS